MRKILLCLMLGILMSIVFASALNTHNESHSITLSNTAASETAKDGIQIKIGDTTIYLTSLTKIATSTSTTAYLLNADKTVNAVMSYTGDTAKFSTPIQMNAGTIYYVVGDKEGVAYSTEYESYSYPVVGGRLNWTGGYKGADNSYACEIISLNYSLSLTTIYNLSVNSPSEISIKSPVNFSVNYTLTNTSFQNMNVTFRITSPNGDITTTINATSSNQSSISYIPTFIGTYNWDFTVCANYSSTTNCETSSSQAFDFLINNQFFQTNIYEMNTENYYLNLSYDSLFYSNIQTKLLINNTLYLTTKTGIGNNFLFTLNKSVQHTNSIVNQSIKWIVILYNSTGSSNYNSTDFNQTINPILISSCSNGFFNLILFDEVTKIIIPNGLNPHIETTFEIHSGQDYSQYVSYSNSTTINNVSYCLNFNLTNQNYLFSSQTKYYADGYSKEFYAIQSYSLSNLTVPINISLFDLNISDSTVFLMTYKDENYIPKANVLLQIERKYINEGLFKIVESLLTDNNGQAKGHFDVDGVIYNIKAIQNGTILYLWNNIVVSCENPTTYDCKLNLNAQTFGTVPFDFSKNGNLNYRISFNDSTRTATLQFSSINGQANNLLWTVRNYNAWLNETVCEQTITIDSGTLTCSVPASYGNATIISELYSNSGLIDTQTYTINLSATPKSTFGFTGILLVAILFVCLALMFITSYEGMIIGGIAGLIAGGLLMLYSGGSLIGSGSTILWLIIAGGIVIWKISQIR